MDTTTPPDVGAKDLRDLKGVSRAPVLAYMQKQAVPDAPRPKPLTPAEAAAAPPPAPPTQTAAAADSLATKAASLFRQLKSFASSETLRWLYEYLRYRIGWKHAFLTYENKAPGDGIYSLKGEGPELRIAVAGDWGTGTDEAHRIAALMSADNPHYTIHLGDVYFVGDPGEVRENFLGQARPGSRYTPCTWPLGSQGSFALNGNHEMYALGNAYFDQILPALGEIKDGKSQKQLASYVCLMNDDWCVLGLDTGYNSIALPVIEYFSTPDCKLPDAIVSWLQAIAPRIGNRAVIILSHHQVLSVYDACYTKPADQIFAILKRPVLWFWGHEHRMVIYEPYAAAGQKWPVITGRCIGHAGMPVDLPGDRKSGLIGNAEYVDYRLYKNDEQLHVGINGFARLKFIGPQLVVEYVDIHGAVALSETFAAREGMAQRTAVTNYLLSQPKG